MGSRPSSRRVTNRLIRLIPKRCWPTTTPLSATLGTRRRSHTGQTRATKICSVTWTGTTGISMTSRVRCTHPPTRPVPHSGQAATACSTRWVGAIRTLAKPWGRLLRVSFRGGCRPEGVLLPGMPGELRLFNRASKAATRCCSWALVVCSSVMMPCCRTIMPCRASRLAVANSSSVSMPLVYHNYNFGCSNSFYHLGLIHLIKSEHLSIPHFPYG